MGEQLGGVIGWPGVCSCWCAAAAGSMGPSLPVARPNRRDTSNVRVSISTSWSSIMQVEYCQPPVGSIRLPCGMVQVVVRATSVPVGVYTTDTDDGTMSPCRLKLTTKA